jgi:hypothetical protein
MRSIIAAATAWSPKTPPQPENGRLLVRMSEAAGDELEEQIRGVLLEGQVADLGDDDQAVAAQLGHLRRSPCDPVARPQGHRSGPMEHGVG